MDTKKLGEIMCNDLANHGISARWFIDPFGELFLVVGDRWLTRCIGERRFGDDIMPYWVPVRQRYNNRAQQCLGKKPEYIPLFD